jgi:hypothetical protein
LLGGQVPIVVDGGPVSDRLRDDVVIRREWIKRVTCHWVSRNSAVACRESIAIYSASLVVVADTHVTALDHRRAQPRPGWHPTIVAMSVTATAQIACSPLRHRFRQSMSRTPGAARRRRAAAREAYGPVGARRAIGYRTATVGHLPVRSTITIDGCAE